MMELGGVFVVHIDCALAICGSKFRLASQWNCSGDGAVCGVDGGSIFPAAIEREHASRDRLVENRVRIRIRLDGADRFQRLQIEDGDTVAAAVASESAAEVGGD